MFNIALFSTLLLGLTERANSAIVTSSLTIANTEVAPDGFTRDSVTANGTIPAPIISGNEGDTFQINVTDSLTDTTMYRGTSIHWHGIFQKSNAYMDGVGWVTQCPIIPGDSYLYNFTVVNQTGTYWYHSHVGTQYCDGLRGPLIIYDPDDPLADLYDVDDETTVITVSDWYHNVSNSLFPNTGYVDPTPNATLINGLGRYSGGPASSLSVLNVTSGKSYRFRLISTSCYASFVFQIDGHNLTVIEADGTETEPVTVDSLTIYPGQRYSFILNANETVDNYWVRADPDVGTTGFSNGINSAILRYSGAADEEPSTIQNTEGVELDETQLHPIVDPAAPGEPYAGGVDYALNLEIELNLTSGLHMIDDVSWSNPPTPVLLQILSGAQSAADLLPAGSIYALPGNSTIEISMPGGASHPMHLHGHNFDVVRVAGSDTYNYVNPVRRDVVNIGTATDNVTIRFTTDNPGPWFFHCHIDWHLAAGLAAVFVEDFDAIPSTESPTDAWTALCPEYSADDPDTAYE